MTVEHRYLVGLKDIISVTLECKKCTSRLSLKPDAVETAPSSCPSCGHAWLSSAVSSGGRHFIDPLFVFLATLPTATTAQEDERNGARILFEINPSLAS